MWSAVPSFRACAYLDIACSRFSYLRCSVCCSSSADLVISSTVWCVCSRDLCGQQEVRYLRRTNLAWLPWWADVYQRKCPCVEWARVGVAVAMSHLGAVNERGLWRFLLCCRIRFVSAVYACEKNCDQREGLRVFSTCCTFRQNVLSWLLLTLMPLPPLFCCCPRFSNTRTKSASKVFISEIISDERKMLAVYPVIFFYTFISWMIVLQ